jgi:hypothetical protein
MLCQPYSTKVSRGTFEDSGENKMENVPVEESIAKKAYLVSSIYS